MVYVFLQIISTIFSFATSIFEIYITIDRKDASLNAFVLYSTRLLSSSTTSIYYALNNFDIIISTIIHKNFAVHILIIFLKIYYLYYSKYYKNYFDKDSQNLAPETLNRQNSFRDSLSIIKFDRIMINEEMPDSKADIENQIINI